MLLTTAQGQCIRFPVAEVRVFKGRDSTGVRGITLAEGDHLISMAILRHVEATPEERAAYLRMRRAVAPASRPKSRAPRMPRKAMPRGAQSSSAERYAEMSARRGGHPHHFRERLRQAILGL